MPSIVTASQLRAILGVSVSLYSDAQLDSYIDSAEQTILPLLTQYQSSVTFANVDDSVIYFTTMRPNYFVPGQSVVVTGAGIYNATYTVTDDRIEPYTFTAATAAAVRTELKEASVLPGVGIPASRVVKLAVNFWLQWFEMQIIYLGLWIFLTWIIYHYILAH